MRDPSGHPRAMRTSLLLSILLLGACDGASPTTPDGGVSACDVGERVGPYEGAACADETHACLRRCDDPVRAEECTEACLAADPSCATCVATTLAACINEACQAEWDAFACCTEGACDARTLEQRASCVRDEARCAVEHEAYGRCASTLTPERQQACGREVETRCNF